MYLKIKEGYNLFNIHTYKGVLRKILHFNWFIENSNVSNAYTAYTHATPLLKKGSIRARSRFMNHTDDVWL